MKKEYFQLYSFVCSKPVKIIRALVISLLLVVIFSRFINQASLITSIAILTCVVIIELFFESTRFVIPEKMVGENSGDLNDSLIFAARENLNSSKNGYEFASSVKNNSSVKFFLKELGIEKIEKFEVSKEELLKQASELVIWIGAKYITQIDLFASYILLSEQDSRFLSKNKLNNDDVINVVYWTRKKFLPDIFKKKKIAFAGIGVFDNLCFGWNYELKKYAKDLTNEVISQRYSPQITGQEKEYEELIVSLSKRKSSNVILIGDAGVGKKNLVEYLAGEMIYGNVPSEISGKKVFELMVDRLISGVTNPGELEKRIGDLLVEISYSGNCIIFIQNIENIFGGGGFNFDVSGVLDEYITNERIKFVGTTTPASYSNFIQNKTSVSDLFEKIEIPDLDDRETLFLLSDKVSEIESKYGVKIQYKALKESVLLSSVFYPDRFSPGRSINLLEEAASKNHVHKKINLTGSDITDFVQEKTNVVLEEPDESEKELLSHLEEKLHERVIGQIGAVTSVSQAIKRLRSGFKNGHRPICVFLFLGPTGVGKTELAKALAREYFGAEDRMIRLDMSEYQTQDQLDRLLGAKAGEEYSANTLLEQVEKQPFSLVLLDEFEKADKKLLNLFLQVFDEGRLTNNQGKSVSFENTIIIATSNAGSEYIRQRIEKNENLDQKDLLDYLLSNNIFTPELINRFDEAIIFKPLTREETSKIASILLKESMVGIKEKGYEIVPSEKAAEKVAADSYSPEFGARNIRRYIQESVEGFLSELILNGKIQKGDKKNLSVDESGNWILV